MEEATDPPSNYPAKLAGGTVLMVLFAISFSHLLNDTIQSLLPATYPVLVEKYGFHFGALGTITLAFQLTASILQPVVGYLTDKKPVPYLLPIGITLSLIGLLFLSRSHTLPMLVFSACLVGSGSSIFHPEASRVAHMAAGNRRGFAQSVFQVGGNAGSSIGPLLVAWVVVPYGQESIAWFALIALVGAVVLYRIGHWQAKNQHRIHRRPKSTGGPSTAQRDRGKVVLALTVLVVLIFSKYIYLSSLSNFYALYLINRFNVSIPDSQYYSFLFLFAVAAGTIIGGPIGDRFGRKRVIWGSILGVAPFSLWLPFSGLVLTAVLSVIIGFILASAFSAILVYAQELLPGKVGMISGLFFGLAFGVAGIAAAELGRLADRIGIENVFRICAFLPLLGLFTIFLPDLRNGDPKQASND